MMREAQELFNTKLRRELPQGFFYRMRKLRLWFAWPFACVLAIYAKSSTTGFWIGMMLIAVGEALRIWSHGYLRKIRALATDGPYAYVRNPLYLGNFLIGAGFCAVIWHPLVFIFFAGGFFLVYWVTVKGEEERLAFRFGQAYADYARAVPRFIPRMKPYSKRQKTRFAFHRVWGHGEFITLLAIVVLLLFLYLRHEFYQNRHPMTLSTLAVSLLIVVMSMALVYIWTARRTRGRRSRGG